MFFCRHSLIPRFTSWPHNQIVNEGDTVHISCTLESCNSLFISRYFIPVSNIHNNDTEIKKQMISHMQPIFFVNA